MVWNCPDTSLPKWNASLTNSQTSQTVNQGMARVSLTATQIEDLVRAQYGRDCMALASEELRALYKSAIPRLWRTLHALLRVDPTDGPPELIVVNSFRARSQTLLTSDRNYLIHDQYL